MTQGSIPTTEPRSRSPALLRMPEDDDVASHPGRRVRTPAGGPLVDGPLGVAIAWVHPALMFGVVAASAWALQLGLRMRNARARAIPRPKAWWHRHLRVAKAALAVGLVGLALGPTTWVFVRGEAPLSSLHGRVGLVTAALAVVLWQLGRRLERGVGPKGPGTIRDVHAALGVLGVLAALVALLTGLELLP